MGDYVYDRSSYARQGTQQRMSYSQASSRFSTFGGSLSTTGSMNHINLRRHLRPAETTTDQQPTHPMVFPQLTRQNAFIADTSSDSSLLSKDSSDSVDDPNIRFLKGKPIPPPSSKAAGPDVRKCRICYGTTEGEHGQLISPCNCRGTIEFVHDTCLQNYFLSNTRISRECSMCLGTLSYPEEHSRHYHFAARRKDSSLRKILIYFTTAITFYLFTEIIRCTEIRKVPGTEFKETSAIGRPEYLWLPIIKRSCWRNGLAGQIWLHASTLQNHIPVALLWIIAIIVATQMYKKLRM